MVEPEKPPPPRRSSDVLDAILDQVTGTPEPSATATGLFRRQALAQLDVAAEVDHQLPLVPRRGWLLLVGAGVLVAAFLLWAGLTPSITAVAATGRAVASPGALPVSAPASGQVVDLPESGAVVRSGQRLASVRAADGALVPITAPADGTVWQVLEVPGAAVLAGGAIATLLPPGSDRSVLVPMPEEQAAPVVPGQAFTGAVPGTVTAVGAPLPAVEAARRTGMALPAGGTAVLVTVDLAVPVPAGSEVPGQVVLSEATVLERMLGRT